MSTSSNLSLFIDVGGDRYYLGSDKPIDLAYGSRNQFLKTFTQPTNNDQKKRRIEDLLRKYMYYSNGTRTYSFDNNEDKQELIDILKKRSKQLIQSNEFSSSLLKNASFQRVLLNLQDIIQELEGSSLKSTTPTNTKNLEFIRSLSKERIAQLILELSWYLLHPDKVPRDVSREWATVIQKLDQLRVADFVDRIHKIEQDKKIEPLGSPLNYFQRINVGKAAASANALEEAVRMATYIQDDTLHDSLKERLKVLLDILQAKKYLDTSLPKNKAGLSNINASTIKKLENQLGSNPFAENEPALALAPEQKGGANKIIDRKWNVAMQPLFTYFKGTFDPVYGFIDETVREWNRTTKNRNIIPSVLLLLHLCQQIHPSESSEGGLPTYGVYRIDNIPSTLLSYVNHLLKQTDAYATAMPDEEKNAFKEQIIKLPNVRLTTLLSPSATPTAFKDPESFPYIQLCTVGGNITIPSKETFLDSDHPKLTEQAHIAVTDFFRPECLYVIVTKGSQTRDALPTHAHTIDFTKVDVEDTTIPIETLPDTYFSTKHTETELYLENLVELKEYVYCNDAELALSILIAYKDRMSM
uniref:Uncharacterized protein n=1 Tax=viral metagenome TaxID=1070528 RepID=A0A6C0KNA0_9ZZZZ